MAAYLSNKFAHLSNDLVICANGSVSEGFATPSSDYDFLILTEQAPETISKGFHTDVIQGKRVEYRLISFTTFRADIEKLRARFRQGGQSWFDIDYGHRLMRGTPLVGEELYRNLVSDADIEALKEAAVDCAYSTTLGTFDDLLGATLAFDTPISALFAKRYMQSCMDLLLAVRGDTYMREKWRALRSRKMLGGDSPLHMEYMQRELFAGDSHRDLEQGVSATLEFAHKLQLCSLISLDLPFEVAAEHGEGHGDKFVISAPAFVVRLKRSFYIRTRQTMHGIDRSMAVVFLAYHTPIASNLIKTQMAVQLGIAPSDVGKMIDVLRTLELIIPFEGG
ncbi:nucleotidyltransferase domain-containing protein [Burkholderia multivorans]|uniref:nucleotidyltransferase domain-containing protein n=2 Tax=Burkholderia multivorans TaxID=87883 RepID=UPI0005B96F2E|nr:nucleotidyltransferase domain-containing protein [Burkholderia multivorans]